MQLVADANVILSAVIGGRAALVLRHERVEQVFTPTAAHDEVFEYLGPLAKKRRLRLDTLLLALAALPITVVERADYDHHLPEADRRMRARDPDDADVLALALHLNLAVGRTTTISRMPASNGTRRPSCSRYSASSPLEEQVIASG